MTFSLGKLRDGFLEDSVGAGPGEAARLLLTGRAVPNGGRAMNRGSEGTCC